MLYRRRKRKRRIKVLLALGCVVTVLIMAISSFEHKVSVFADSYIQSFARQVSTEAVCTAVDDQLDAMQLSYNDLAKLQYADDGSVRSVETDSVQFNRIKAKVTKAAQEELVKIKNNVMYIPLGAFTGLSLIANYGPPIGLSFCLTGSVNARIESTFESAGVNQTVHHIRLIVTSRIVTASVDYDGYMEYETDFELAQSVLVGDIPTTYGGYYPVCR